MKKTFKVIGIVLLSILIVSSLGIGIYAFVKPADSPVPKPGADLVLTSEKYGTFVIPETAGLTPIYNLYYPNGTNFTYIKEEIYNLYNSYSIEQLAAYSSLDTANGEALEKMKAIDSYELVFENNFSSKEGAPDDFISKLHDMLNVETAFRQSFNDYFHFKDNVFNFNIDNEFYKLYVLNNYDTEDNGFFRFNMCLIDKATVIDGEINNYALIDYTRPNAIKVFSYLNEYTLTDYAGFESSWTQVVGIVSDKGYPLTETIYNELIAEAQPQK